MGQWKVLFNSVLYRKFIGMIISVATFFSLPIIDVVHFVTITPSKETFDFISAN